MPTDNDQILVLNAGSSSLKFSILREEATVCKGVIDRLEASQPDGCRAEVSGADRAKLFDGSIPAKDHEQALEWLFGWLSDHQALLRPLAVGHRVVHGGDEFIAPARVSAELVRRLEALIPLAPLHQPHNLAPIRFLARRF